MKALGKAAISIMLTGLSGCMTQPAGETAATAASIPDKTTSDIKRIATAGPSLSFNNLTGGPNDVASHPVTGLPSVAYYDKTANVTGTAAVGALKLATMEADGRWNIEIIDANTGTTACGTAGSFCIGAPNANTGARADIISLAFMSDGTPAIAYAYGASFTGAGFKQIRYAQKTSAGWTNEVAFASSTAVLATNVNIANTVEPLTAVNLKFDTSNRAHITFGFYAQTLTNSRYKYLFRDSGGTWTGSDIMAIASGAGAISTMGQGMMQGGLVMCGGTNPVVSGLNIDGAAGVGKTIYANCAATGATGACTTWNTINAQTGCAGGTCFGAASITNTSNAGQRTDLTLGAGNKPLLAVYSTATPNNTLYTLLMPNLCSSNPPATANSWGSPTAIGAANDGLNGFEVEATATNYYLAFYRSTTSVMLTTCSASSCTWLATPATVETTTVAREGLALNVSSTNDQIFVSYARLPAAVAGAVGNDILLATGGTSDIVSGGNLVFAQSIVDNLPDLFPSTAVPSMSTATAPNGLIGYAYFYQDTTVADAKLYYGVRAGPKTDPVFPSQFVTSHQESGAAALVGTYPSLVYNSKSQPIIAYYNGQNRSLDVAISQMNTGFSIVTVDDHATDDLGQFASAAITGNTIGVSYYDATATGLKFARFTPNIGWKRFAVDGMTGTGSCGNAASTAGKFSSLKFTSDGRPVIAYQFDGKLRVAYASEALTSATYTWTCVTIDSNGNTRGEGIALAISLANQIHIAHFDASLGSVRYSSSTGDIATAIALGVSAFSGETIDNTGITTSVVSTPGIALTATGVVYVSYFSDSYHGLALAARDLAGSWTKEYVDVVSAPYPTAQGQNTTLTLSLSDLPVVFYRSNENWIKYFGREYD